MQSVCRPHPLREFLHACPVSNRCYRKPRGYAGDAVLLDMIYDQRPHQADDVPAHGVAVLEYLTDTASSRAVRHRRDLLTQRINEAAAASTGCRILSLACGHLREAQQAEAVHDGRVAEFVAIDQDRESVAVVDREQSQFGVRPVVGTVGQLLKGQLAYRDMSLNYAAGLYDYLPEPLAVELTRVLFRTLGSGGRLVLANFARDIPEAGYMEAYMDWMLNYRDETEVAGWASGIPSSEIAACDIWRDPHGSIIYLELQRR